MNIAAGVWPSHDWKGNCLNDPRAGQPLAGIGGVKLILCVGHSCQLLCHWPLGGGYFACLWQIQCDLAWHPQWLLLPGHNARSPCQLCNASREELFSIDHEHHPRIMTPGEWRARFQGIPRSINLWNVPGLSGLHVSPDIMHTKWLGCDTYLLGSVLKLLYDIKFQRQIGDLCHELELYAPSSMHAFVHNMTEKKFSVPGKFPCLKGRAVDVRGLTVPILELWQSKKDANSRNEVLIGMLLQRSRAYDTIVIENSDVPCLPGNDAWQV